LKSIPLSYAIRTQRPDLNLRLCALDISKDTLEFAEAGVYSLEGEEGSLEESPGVLDPGGHVAVMTSRDQPSSIFERMSSVEMEAIFERDGRHVRDHASGMGLVGVCGSSAMDPDEAEFCLRNLAHLVKGGGYLFVSGVDLDVRSKVAREFGWRPVTELIQEINEGDPCLCRDWPLQYWGLEPFAQGRDDWKIWSASVFQMPEHSLSEVSAGPHNNGEFNRKSAGHKSKWFHIALLHRISDGTGQ
jgi:hypothetical protein